jgi:hypothetical protein
MHYLEELSVEKNVTMHGNFDDLLHLRSFRITCGRATRLDCKIYIKENRMYAGNVETTGLAIAEI